MTDTCKKYDHTIETCKEFAQMTVEKRKGNIKNKILCTNCLGKTTQQQL
jgi:hypothetical protein